MNSYSIVLLTLFITNAAYAKPFPPLSGPVVIVHDQKAESEFDFSGIAALPGCSASIINMGQAPTAKALLLTNGHCVGMMEESPDTVYYHHSYRSSGSAFVKLHDSVSIHVTSVVYGIMQPHDFAILELKETYQELLDQGVKSRTFDPQSAKVGEKIFFASGYFQSVSSCNILDIIYRLKEDKWLNEDTYKYRECDSMHGTSGTPLISALTDKIIGINMTGNDSGEKCTFNNPCEIDKNGVIRVDKGAGYGDQVYKIMTCLDAAKNLDLSVKGCLLPKAK